MPQDRETSVSFKTDPKRTLGTFNNYSAFLDVETKTASMTKAHL